MVSSSTRIQPDNMTHEGNVKYFKGKRPNVLPEEDERRRKKCQQSRGCSKKHTADGATKSILIIMGYYLLSSLFFFILPNSKATLPIGHEDRIIVIRSVYLLHSTNSIVNFVVFFIVNKRFRFEVLKAFRFRK